MLLRLGLLGDFQQRPELLFRGGHCGHFRRYAAVGQVFEDAFRVPALLAGLLDEILAEAFEVSDIAPHGQGEIGVGGGEFLVELPDQFLDHFLGNFGFMHNYC